MELTAKIGLLLAELVALMVVVFVWRRKDITWPSKLGRTVLLLIPMVGILLYGLATLTPDEHNVSSNGDGWQP